MRTQVVLPQKCTWDSGRFWEELVASLNGFGCSVHFPLSFSVHTSCQFKTLQCGNSLVVQGLGLCASTAGGMGLILGGASKILHAAWCGQRKKKTTQTNNNQTFYSRNQHNIVKQLSSKKKKKHPKPHKVKNKQKTTFNGFLLHLD